ncbi:MAG: DUF2059 domain-containing protein [Methyloligellaceae bacterium]
MTWISRTFAVVLLLALVGQPAHAAESDADRLAAAQDVLAATGGAKQFDRIIPLIANTLRDGMIRAHPKLQQPLTDVFKAMLAGFAERKDAMMSEVAQAYARLFTVAELKTIATFYRSEVGRKFVETAPKLAAEGIRIGRKWGDIISRELRAKVEQEMRQRGHKI